VLVPGRALRKHKKGTTAQKTLSPSSTYRRKFHTEKSKMVTQVTRQASPAQRGCRRHSQARPGRLKINTGEYRMPRRGLKAAYKGLQKSGERWSSVAGLQRVAGARPVVSHKHHSRWNEAGKVTGRRQQAAKG